MSDEHCCFIFGIKPVDIGHIRCFKIFLKAPGV